MNSMEKAEAEHVTRTVQQDLVSHAEDATVREHELSIAQALKLYPKGIAWSVMMSTALVMDGYDLKLIGSLFAQPAFNRTYGKRLPDGSYQISAPWQSGLNNGSNVGQLIGLTISGYVCERFGFRKSMFAALSVAPCLVFIQFFALSLPVLEVAQILLGIPLGMFQTITCVYAIEVMPTCLRAYLTSYVNMCWLMGQLIASGVLRGTLQMSAPWAYRVPFAIQWLWPIPLMIGVFFAPESPWWLVRQNRIDDAKTVVRQLIKRSDASFDVDKNVALMVLTTEHERELNASTRFVGCFRGIDLRRTIIVIGCYCMQVLSGTPLRAYATYFMQQAGLATDQAFNMSIVVYALGLAGVMTSWLFMSRIGRRTLFLCGLTALAVIYCIIGGLGVPQAAHASSDYAWAIGALLLISTFVANSTIGAVSYALVSEIPSSLLRSKSVVIARFCYAVLNIAANVITPYQLNPSGWNWSAKSGFWWCGSCVIGWIFTFFFIPEPKDRTIAELDLLFEKKTPARKFKATDVSVSEIAEKEAEP